MKKQRQIEIEIENGAEMEDERDDEGNVRVQCERILEICGGKSKARDSRFLLSTQRQVTEEAMPFYFPFLFFIFYFSNFST